MFLGRFSRNPLFHMNRSASQSLQLCCSLGVPQHNSWHRGSEQLCRPLFHHWAVAGESMGPGWARPMALQREAVGCAEKKETDFSEVLR